MGTAYFQSIAKSKQAILLGSLRQFALLIPLVLLLPLKLGLTGVWIATPIADGMTIVLTLILLVIELRKPDNHQDTHVNQDNRDYKLSA